MTIYNRFCNERNTSFKSDRADHRDLFCHTSTNTMINFQFGTIQFYTIDITVFVVGSIQFNSIQFNFSSGRPGYHGYVWGLADWT